MKRQTVSTALLAVGLSLGTVVAAPANAIAAPASCQYVAKDLPLPSGSTSAELVTSSPDNAQLLGKAGPDGVIWRDGQVAEVLKPPGSRSSLYPKGINNRSTVVGFVEPRGGSGQPVFAFRYSGGRYFKLYTPEGYASIAYSINDRNDIAGVIYPVSAPDKRTPVVWDPLMYKYTTLVGSGPAIAVSSDRKVLTNEGNLYDLNTGGNVRLNGHEPYLLDNQRIFSFAFGSLPEWDLTGTLVRTYDKGVEPGGVNKHNTLFGNYGPERIDPGLWSNGEWAPVQADKRPEVYPYGDITDDGVLIANYRAADGNRRAARWFCA